MGKRNIYKLNRQSKSRKWRKITFVLPVFAALFVVGSHSFKADLDLTPRTTQSTAQQVSRPTEPPYDLSAVTFPSEGQSAIGTLDFGVIRTSTQTEQITPMASITKIITALAILEKAPLDPGEKGDTITLTAQDEQYYHEYLAMQGTITPVTAGLTMTQYDALQAILLPSSNNIADTLVDRYFRTREEYLNYANEMLSRFGLQYTQVADASGFSPQSVSTPSEMIVIGQKALQNPVIAEIVAQAKATIALAGEVRNYNPLILEPGVNGIKPGTTDEAGYCLLFSVNIADKSGKNTTVIGVVMGLRANLTYLTEIETMLTSTRNTIENQEAKP